MFSNNKLNSVAPEPARAVSEPDSSRLEPCRTEAPKNVFFFQKIRKCSKMVSNAPNMLFSAYVSHLKSLSFAFVDISALLNIF